jgi:co-chaperonin GroES (HSP10)
MNQKPIIFGPRLLVKVVEHQQGLFPDQLQQLLQPSIQLQGFTLQRVGQLPPPWHPGGPEAPAGVPSVPSHDLVSQLVGGPGDALKDDPVPARGYVVVAGDGWRESPWSDPSPLRVGVGDEILFFEQQGTRVQLDNDQGQREEYVLIPESYVLVVVSQAIRS